MHKLCMGSMQASLGNIQYDIPCQCMHARNKKIFHTCFYGDFVGFV